jgi:hypothetical protein
MTCARLLALAFLAPPALADGDVTVLIDAEGDVIVTGDDQANEIDHGAEGKLAITPRPGTTVNGSSEPFLLPPVRGRYLVDLGAGNDRFETSTVLRPGSEIRTGDGDDRVLVGNSGAGGSGILIDTGAGDDFVDVQDSGFSILRIFTRDGADEVQLVFAFPDAVVVHTGDGDDLLEMFDCTFDGPVTLFGGPGADEIVQDDVVFFGPRPKIVGWEIGRRAEI